MAKLIFLEGVLGVGKSTMARSLCEDLQSKGLSAKAYIEFDYTNPIDFYCVAYYFHAYVAVRKKFAACFPRTEFTIFWKNTRRGRNDFIHQLLCP